MTYLRDGHAPGDLRDAFRDLVELGLAEVEFRGRMFSARALCGLLWNCTDVLPQSIGNDLDVPSAGTYAAAARVLRSQRAGEVLA